MGLCLTLASCSDSTGTGVDRGGAQGDDDVADDDDDSPTSGPDAAAGAQRDGGNRRDASSAGPDAGRPASTRMDGAIPSVPGNDGGGSARDGETASDAGSAPSEVDAATPGAGPAPITTKCKGGAVEPCGTFVTRDGTEIPLGKYGALMEPNVGVGFENQVNALDTASACSAFASFFGQDPSATQELLDIEGLDLKLHTVYRPANWVEGEKYPIVVWGNGTCAQPEGYSALLRYVASQGFFVVAPNSRYVGSGNEQKRAIDFAVAANADADGPYYGRLDPDKVAAMGHSQGGGGTRMAASDPRVKTVILFNGGTSASKPFLGISGDRDTGNPTPQSYSGPVQSASKAAYIFYHMIPGTGTADGHLTLMTQPQRVVEPTAAWLKLLLLDDAASREWFVGPNCKLCGRESEFHFGQKGL